MAAFEASVEANVEATSCGVNTDVRAGEAIVVGATTKSDAGEAIEPLETIEATVADECDKTLTDDASSRTNS